ncbi:hypothetical protein [Flavobacterium sp.]|nr:hypothetical protein [Flavobacterium sp.]
MKNKKILDFLEKNLIILGAGTMQNNENYITIYELIKIYENDKPNKK